MLIGHVLWIIDDVLVHFVCFLVRIDLKAFKEKNVARSFTKSEYRALASTVVELACLG